MKWEVKPSWRTPWWTPSPHNLATMPRHNLISSPEAARTLDVSQKALRAWVRAGIGPAPDRLGRYDREGLAEWAQEMSAGQLHY